MEILLKCYIRMLERLNKQPQIMASVYFASNTQRDLTDAWTVDAVG